MFELTKWNHIIKWCFICIQSTKMNKRWKIALYVVLVLAIIAVIWLMFGNTNPNVETPSDVDNEVLTWEEISDSWTTVTYENTDTFEEDVMKDLEWFFWTNNGYEDVEWEFWFTSTEAE